MEEASQPMTRSDLRPQRAQLDSKTIMIGALLGICGGLLGWNLSNALGHDASAASALPEIAGVGESPPSLLDQVEPAAPGMVVIFNVAPAADAEAAQKPADVSAPSSPVSWASTTPSAIETASARETPSAKTTQPPIVSPPATIYQTNTTQVLNRLWLQILAMDGSIVFLGPDGQLNANTGDATGGGIVALAPEDSSLQTSSPSASVAVPRAGGATTDSSATNVTRLISSMLQTGLSPSSGSMDVDIEGFEDHSLHVVGNGQIVTNDDSNIFINRNGLINANTGDTDSSGLIAVDVTNSVIRSGESGDDDEDSDGEDDDSDSDADDEAEEDAEEEADERTTESATPTVVETDSGSGGPDGADSSLTIGGDGFDDISLHAEGNGNIVTADDSNIVVGGTGQVNAQIGDADTGGVIVMGVHGSVTESGCAGDSCGPPRE